MGRRMRDRGGVVGVDGREIEARRQGRGGRSRDTVVAATVVLVAKGARGGDEVWQEETVAGEDAVIIEGAGGEEV